MKTGIVYLKMVTSHFVLQCLSVTRKNIFAFMAHSIYSLAAFTNQRISPFSVSFSCYSVNKTVL